MFHFTDPSSLSIHLCFLPSIHLPSNWKVIGWVRVAADKACWQMWPGNRSTMSPIENTLGGFFFFSFLFFATDGPLYKGEINGSEKGGKKQFQFTNGFLPKCNSKINKSRPFVWKWESLTQWCDIFAGRLHSISTVCITEQLLCKIMQKMKNINVFYCTVKSCFGKI